MAKSISKLKITLNEAGKLSAAISNKDIDRITHLTIKGKIDATDFETMRDDMQSLSHINLRECDIEAIAGYGADTVPDMAFTHYLGLNEYGEKTYEAKHWLKKVILPESAKVIGVRAFCHSKKLREIELPKNLVCICDRAFYGCAKLNDYLDFPESLKKIGERAFRYCRSINYELVFPEGLEEIGDGAFEYCTRISNIKLPKSNCKIGESAFLSCGEIFADLVIPDGCKKIEPLAFCDCQRITSVEIPASCKEIGSDCFGDTYRLSKVVMHPATPPKLGKNVFDNQEVQTDLFVPEGCYAAYKNSEWGVKFRFIFEHTRTIELSEAGTLDKLATDNDKFWIQRIVLRGRIDERDFQTLRNEFRSLTHIDLSESIIDGDKLPAEAFRNCNTLIEVLLPNNLITVENSAFSGCRTLRKVHFPDTLREVKDMVFEGCRLLSEVKFDSINTPIFGVDIFRGNERCFVVVPENCTESYKQAIKAYLYATFICIRN